MPGKRNHRGQAVTHPELDLFALKPTQLPIEEEFWDPVRCTNLNSTDYRYPLDFTVNGLDDYFISPRFMLKLQLSIKNPEGVEIAADKAIAPVNSYLTSLFKDAELTVGSTTLPYSTGCYPYQAYMKSLFNFSSASQKTWLMKSLYSRDTPLHFDDVQPADNSNAGFTTRSKWLMSGQIELFGPLHLDIESADKLLPSKLNVNLKLHRSDAQWVLMSNIGDDQKVFKISIDLAELYVKRYRLRCADIRHLENGIGRSAARYEYISTSLLAITFPSQTTKLDYIVHNGALPRKACVTMISQAAFNGSYAANPFFFRHNNVRSITYDWSGRQIPKTNQEWTWSAPFSYSQIYYDMLQNMSRDGIDQSDILITPEDFKSGYSFFVQPLQPDYDPAYNYKNQPQYGILTIKMELKEKMASPFMVLVFLDHEKTMIIEKNLDVRVE